MIIGACGIACELGCGLYSKGVCQGCDRTHADKIPCPVLQCSVKKQVEYCGRDCGQFPCDVFKQGFPYSQAYLGMYSGRLLKANQAGVSSHPK